MWRDHIPLQFVQNLPCDCNSVGVVFTQIFPQTSHTGMGLGPTQFLLRTVLTYRSRLHNHVDWDAQI